MIPFNKQAIFSIVATHLLTQARRSVSGYDACSYRGGGGTKCAVGALITDECYYPDLEGRRVSVPMVANAVSKSTNMIVDSEAVEFLTRLQAIHDNWDPTQWADCLRGLAKGNELDLPEILKGA